MIVRPAREATRHSANYFRVMETLAERALDLSGETVR